jgi:hypothetical protein
LQRKDGLSGASGARLPALTTFSLFAELRATKCVEPSAWYAGVVNLPETFNPPLTASCNAASTCIGQLCHDRGEAWGPAWRVSVGCCGAGHP